MKLTYLSVCLLFMVTCKQKNKINTKMKQTINKQIVINFYKKVIGEQDLDYAKKIVTENYIQHNPHIKTGKIGFLEAIAFLKKMPKTKQSPNPFMRIITENDYVVVHQSVEFGGQKKLVLDMFRLENGLIAEHWDAIQNTSEMRLNANLEIEGPILIEQEEATLVNKKLIESFANTILIKRDFEALPRFVAANLIQHNPKITNGLKGLLAYYQNIKI